MLKCRVFWTLLLSTVFIYSANAAEVLKVKGSAILIDTAGDDLKMGSTYYLISNGKKKGLVKIVKLRPGQALGKLFKGTALPNWVLKKYSRTRKKPVAKKRKKIKAPQPKSMYSKKKRRKKRSYSKQSKLAIGAAMGMNQNSSTVIFKSPERTDTDTYSGSSTSFEILADYHLYNKFHLRGSLGMQNFNAGGDPKNAHCIKY